MGSFRKVSGGEVIFNRRFYGILNLISSFENYITKDFRIIVEQNAVNYEITKDDLLCIITYAKIWNIIGDL